MKLTFIQKFGKRVQHQTNQKHEPPREGEKDHTEQNTHADLWYVEKQQQRYNQPHTSIDIVKQTSREKPTRNPLHGT